MRAVGLVVGILMLASFANAQAPLVNPGGVVNGANYLPSGVSPGSIVSIFGSNLASKSAIGDTIPLSNTLDTVTSVTFNGVASGIYYAGPLQINVQMPWEIQPNVATGESVNVVVNTNTGSSIAQDLIVVPALPSIFTVNQRGTGQAIATDNADGAFAAPAGSISGANAHPFSLSTQGQNGHALILWCTGLGAVDPAIADGANSYDAQGNLTLRRTVQTPVITVGGVPAQVIFSGLAPAFVSECQVDVLLGPGTPTGDAVPVQIAASDGLTPAVIVTIAVGN